MNRVDSQYIDLMRDILDNGVYKQTRAGWVKSVFGRQMRFNLKEGLPLLTTKKVFVKGIIHELLFFLSGKCTIDYLKDNNVHIWDGDCERWDKESGTIIGKAYGYQWRHYGGSKVSGFIDKTPFQIKINDIINIEKNGHIGEIYFSNECGEFKIISKSDKTNYYNIQFSTTGYIKENVNITNIKNGSVYDPYYPKIHGIACMGNVDRGDEMTKKIYSIWKSMIDRCYLNTHKEYHAYGGNGVRVSRDWKCFEFFYKDFFSIMNVEEKIKNWSEYELDKDLIDTKCGLLYSKETCLFLKKNENIKLQELKRKIYKVSKDDKIYECTNIASFCKENNITSVSHFGDVLRGKEEQYCGWRLVEVDDRNGVDQIQKIIDTLKTNPDDRRMMCMAWNVDDFDKMALPPCHYCFQVYTRELTPIERLEWLWEHSNGQYDEWKSPTKQALDDLNVPERELSLMFQMRSNDFCCGNPYNIAQYAMLAYMFCEVCNMVPGELIYNGGDVHIYENHFEAAKEQLSRSGSDKIPTLRFARKIDNIDDFKYEDFIIENYEPDAIIKYKLNVG